jgi:hypothetical protein
MPHVPPLHVATPFDGCEHGVHMLPQLLVLVLLRHAPLQLW